MIERENDTITKADRMLLKFQIQKLDVTRLILAASVSVAVD